MFPYEHRWGESAAADNVWAQVAGLAPSLVSRRHFMVLQAFMDESEGVDGTFVLAGHIATAEAWANFSKEWEAALPLATLKPETRSSESVIHAFRPIDERLRAGNAERFHFKMAEMTSEERMKRVPAFFRIIERHAIFSLSVRVHSAELKRARERIYVPNLYIDWGFLNNTYLVAFRSLMDHFHQSKDMISRVIPTDATVDFYFDERGEKKIIREMWDNYIEARAPELRARYGHEPRFENDQKFLPLQAADLWAWWVRKWHSERRPQTMEHGEGYLGLGPKHPKMDIQMDEEGMVTVAKDIIRREIEPGRPIFDVKMNFTPWRGGS